MNSHSTGDDRGLLVLIAAVLLLILGAAILWARMTDQTESPSAETPTVIRTPATPAPEPPATEGQPTGANASATREG